MHPRFFDAHKKRTLKESPIRSCVPLVLSVATLCESGRSTFGRLPLGDALGSAACYPLELVRLPEARTGRKKGDACQEGKKAERQASQSAERRGHSFRVLSF
jgi:hypothetical protein